VRIPLPWLHPCYGIGGKAILAHLGSRDPCRPRRCWRGCSERRCCRSWRRQGRREEVNSRSRPMVMTMSLSAGREEGTARLYTEFCTRGLGSWPRPRDLRNVDHKTGYTRHRSPVTATEAEARAQSRPEERGVLGARGVQGLVTLWTLP
jgi:hypothetical protein